MTPPHALIAAADLHRVVASVLPFADPGDRAHVLEAVRLYTDGQLLVATATDTRIVAEDRARLLQGQFPDRLLHRDDAEHLLRLLPSYGDLPATITEYSPAALAVEVAGDQFRVGTYSGGTSGYPDFTSVLRTGGQPAAGTGTHLPPLGRDALTRVAAAAPGPDAVLLLSSTGPGQPIHVHAGGTFRAAIMPAPTGRPTRGET